MPFWSDEYGKLEPVFGDREPPTAPAPDPRLSATVRQAGGGAGSEQFMSSLINGLNFTGGGYGGGMVGPTTLKLLMSRGASTNDLNNTLAKLAAAHGYDLEKLHLQRQWDKEDKASRQKTLATIMGRRDRPSAGAGAPREPSPGVGVPYAEPGPAIPDSVPALSGPAPSYGTPDPYAPPGAVPVPSGGGSSIGATMPPRGAGNAVQSASQPTGAPPPAPSRAVDAEMAAIDQEISDYRRRLDAGVAIGDKTMVDATKSELSRLERRRNELMDQRKSQSAFEKKQDDLRAEWEEGVRIRGNAFNGFMGHIDALRRLPKEFKDLGYNFDAAVGPMHSAPYGSEAVGTVFSAVTPGYTEMRDAIKQRAAMIVDEIKALRAKGEGTLSDKDMEGFEKQAGDLLNSRNEAEFNRRLDRLVRGMADKFRAKGVSIELSEPGETRTGPADQTQNVVPSAPTSAGALALDRLDRAIAANPDQADALKEQFRQKFGRTPEQARESLNATQGSSGLLPSIVTPAQAVEPSWQGMPRLGSSQRDRDKQVMGR